MRSNSISARKTLPWWTWVVPLILFQLGTQISLWSKVTTGSSLFYFPGPIALILVYWWGPRVLPAFYLNAVFSAGLWGLERIWLWPLYGLPEVVFVFLSWLFFIRIAKGKCWLPDIRQVIYFLMLGILLPLVIYKFFLELVFIYYGDNPVSKFWDLLVITSLGDFISIFGLCLPVLYFLTRPMTDNALTIVNQKIPKRIVLIRNQFKTVSKSAEIVLLCLIVLVLNQFLKFGDYWFLYGVFSLYAAIRFGFGMSILFNSYVLLLTYMLPSIVDVQFAQSLIKGDDDMLKTQLGTGLLYVFSTVTGRVMSDMGAVEKKLNIQNRELEQTNKELDHFVYSVSHDLSAPLKSILGLVNISRISANPQEHQFYFTKIETSVMKLDTFIREVLHYSQNKRLDLVLEQIQLKDLCTEILDNLEFMDGFNKISIDLSDLKVAEITNDKTRLRIILNNLITNAVKFQKKIPDHRPYIKISSSKKLNAAVIDIEDNGEGIRPEVLTKIFTMFYRGHDASKGSGLGLYIAKEAAERIEGTITVKSEFGKGSVFSVELENFKKS